MRDHPNDDSFNASFDPEPRQFRCVMSKFFLAVLSDAFDAGALVSGLVESSCLKIADSTR
jgi:hypothetical protein